MTEPATAALAPSEPCLRCGRCAGCHAPTGDCPVPNTSCATGTCPTGPATAAHQHEWDDTGFSDLDECVCGATRSTTTGRVLEADEIAALQRQVRLND